MAIKATLVRGLINGNTNGIITVVRMPDSNAQAARSDVSFFNPLATIVVVAVAG